MKQGFLWLAGATFLLFAGCGFVRDNYQKVANDFVAVLSEVNDVLESVKSGKEAERAAGRIEKLSIRVDELTLRVKKLAPATKDKASLDRDFKTKRDREQNRFKAAQQRLNSKGEVARVLLRPMMQLSRAIFDLDVASFEYNNRSFRHAMGNPGGTSSGGEASAARGRQGHVPAAGLDSFESARGTRMRQLAGKYGSNRVAMVRIVELSRAANRARLFDEVRASAKVPDSTMLMSPGELTVFLAPVGDLQVVARQIQFGKVTQVNSGARTITVNMKQPK